MSLGVKKLGKHFYLMKRDQMLNCNVTMPQDHSFSRTYCNWTNNNSLPAGILKNNKLLHVSKKICPFLTSQLLGNARNCKIITRAKYDCLIIELTEELHRNAIWKVIGSVSTSSAHINFGSKPDNINHSPVHEMEQRHMTICAFWIARHKPNSFNEYRKQ